MAERHKSTDAEAFQIALGSVLKSIREANDINQIDVAVAIERQRTYISELESGKHNPSIDTLRLLCNFYDISLSELFQQVEDFYS